jgi:hypothetical protein
MQIAEINECGSYESCRKAFKIIQIIEEFRLIEESI